jgi:opacity protein-like surface antigen
MAFAAAGAAAQSSTTTAPRPNSGYEGDGWFARPVSGSPMSYLPFTANGYAGINIGRSRYDRDCSPGVAVVGAIGGFPCDDDATGFKIYTGGQLYRVVGLDLAYLHMGSVDRNGGRSRAQGISLSAVGNLPIWNFNAFAKVGATYGFTRVRTGSAGLPSGSERGVGLNYGAGLQYDFTKALGARLEWDRARFRFVDGRDNVDLVSAGLVLRFQ